MIRSLVIALRALGRPSPKPHASSFAKASEDIVAPLSAVAFKRRRSPLRGVRRLGYLPATCCLLALSACGEGQNARDILGLSRKAPDEFKIVARPPLSVPPDFALRPPREGADTTNLPPADTTARAMVTGNEEEIIAEDEPKMGASETAVGIVQSYELESNADESFLTQIGAEKADASIRDTLEKEQVMKETLKEQESEESFGWLKPEKDEDAVIVDAKAEKARLKANQEAGKDVIEGDTPVIEPKTKGPLEKLLEE